MPSTVAEVMTRNPLTLDADATLVEAARAMRDEDIGDVIVCDKDRICGIVTDRDVVVRAVAEGRPVEQMHVRDICSSELVTVSPDAPIEEAIRKMHDRALRRLPVVDGKRAVGIVSIGDLAMEREPQSALAGISAAPGNT